MIRYLVIINLILGNTIGTEFMKSCVSDTQCNEFYNDAYICRDNKCKHEGWFPLTVKKISALIIITLVSILTNAAGIGGGAIFIPVYTLLLDFTVGGAIPLSKATILAGAVTNIVLAYDDRLQDMPNKFIIDYKLVSFIVPLILAGTMIGVILMKILPPLIIFVSLVGYLFISIKKVVSKGLELH